MNLTHQKWCHHHFIHSGSGLPLVYDPETTALMLGNFNASSSCINSPYLNSEFLVDHREMVQLTPILYSGSGWTLVQIPDNFKAQYKNPVQFLIAICKLRCKNWLFNNITA